MATTFSITGGAYPIAKKVIVYGPEGIGKTSFAAKFPNPVFIDTEHSTDNYDVNRLPEPISWEMIIEEVKYIKENPKLCDTLVIDTADWAEKLCTKSFLLSAKKKSIEDFGYGKGYVMLAEKWQTLLNELEGLRNCGVNVVLTAHCALRKFEQPDEMGSYDRYELKLSKHLQASTKEWADMILFANYKTVVVTTDSGKAKAQGAKRTMYTSHNACWDAKNRYGLDDALPFEYEQISHLFTEVSKKPVDEDLVEPKPMDPASIAAIDVFKACGISYKVYQYGNQINAADKEGIVHCFYPTTGKMVFHHGNDKNDRNVVSMDGDINRFIKALNTSNLVKILFKE